MVLRLRQHNIGYTADGFCRSDEHNVEKYIQWVTALSLTIRVNLYSFSCCCLRNLRNPAKFSENSNL